PGRTPAPARPSIELKRRVGTGDTTSESGARAILNQHAKSFLTVLRKSVGGSCRGLMGFIGFIGLRSPINPINPIPDAPGIFTDQRRHRRQGFPLRSTRSGCNAQSGVESCGG